MSYLYITVGIPCSGKSTWARDEQSKRPDKVRIVTRDDIRAMCGSRFEDGDEKIVADIRDSMIAHWLNAGYDVICADTNLSSHVRNRLRSVAHGCRSTMEVKVFDVDLELALSRNDQRWAEGDTKVPNSAIISMYETFNKEKDKL